MKARVFMMWATVLAAVLLPLPSTDSANAAIVHNASLVDADPTLSGHVPRMSPRALSASPGDSIKWTHSDPGYSISNVQYPAIHTVTAYYGATFASPTMSIGDTFTAPYSGGTVLYRCLYHSTLDTRVSPPGCSGMCGAIHDTTPDTTAPTVAIATRTGFVFTGAVRIDGTAKDNRAVSSVEVRFEPVVEIPGVVTTKKVQSVDGSDLNPCAGCYGPDVKWTARSDQAVNTSMPVLTLPPGQYRVQATAVDPHGNVGSASPIIIYVIL